MKKTEFVIPDAVKENPNALRVMQDFMDQASRAYHDMHAYIMSGILRQKYKNFVKHNGLNRAFENNPKYFYLAIDSAMRALWTDENSSEEDRKLYREYRKDYTAAEKIANENARAVLPNAVCTNLTMTMNARELLHFFKLRCCNRA